MTPYKAIEAAKTVAASLDKRFQTFTFSNAIENVQWAEGWADGRQAPKGIAYTNWNDPTVRTPVGRGDIKFMSRLCNILEKMGVEIEWFDQVTTCDDCGLLVQTEPDSYGWQPAFVETNHGITCAKCLEGNATAYLEGLEGTTSPAIESVDPSEHGYLKIAKDLERGLHEGQDADPRVIAKTLRAKGVSRFIFQVDDVGQFDARFSVWVHEEESDLVTELSPDETEGPSVSGAMKRFLNAIPLL